MTCVAFNVLHVPVSLTAFTSFIHRMAPTAHICGDICGKIKKNRKGSMSLLSGPR